MPDYDCVEFLEDLRQMNFSGAIISAADQSVGNGATGLAETYGLNVIGVIFKPLTIQNLVPALAHAGTHQATIDVSGWSDDAVVGYGSKGCVATISPARQHDPNKRNQLGGPTRRS